MLIISFATTYMPSEADSNTTGSLLPFSHGNHLELIMKQIRLIMCPHQKVTHEGLWRSRYLCTTFSSYVTLGLFCPLLISAVSTEIVYKANQAHMFCISSHYVKSLFNVLSVLWSLSRLTAYLSTFTEPMVALQITWP